MRNNFDTTTFNTKLIWLNECNGAAKIHMEYVDDVIDRFKNDIVTCEIGCAYGGGIEAIAKRLKGHGDAYGFDTFSGHPRQLAKDPNDFEALCMDYWYSSSMFGMERLDKDYQEGVFNDLDLTNAHLIKGLVNENSFDFLDKIHLAFIDLDMIVPTRMAYAGVKDKIVSGGYLLMHDTVPENHLPELNKFMFSDIMNSGLWTDLKTYVPSYLSAVRKI